MLLSQGSDTHLPSPSSPDLCHSWPAHHSGRTLQAPAPKRRSPLGLAAPLGLEITYQPVCQNTKNPSKAEGVRGRVGVAHPPALLQTLGVGGTYMIPVAQPPSGGEGEARLHRARGSGTLIRGVH